MSVNYKLEPYDINELKRKAIRTVPYNCTPRNCIGIIEEFVNSGNDCCRVCTCDTDRKAHVECTILRRSVQIGNYSNTVRVVLRGENVYLVKKDKWEKT